MLFCLVIRVFFTEFSFDFHWICLNNLRNTRPKKDQKKTNLIPIHKNLVEYIFLNDKRLFTLNKSIWIINSWMDNFNANKIKLYSQQVAMSVWFSLISHSWSSIFLFAILSNHDLWSLWMRYLVMQTDHWVCTLSSSSLCGAYFLRTMFSYSLFFGYMNKYNKLACRIKPKNKRNGRTLI